MTAAAMSSRSPGNPYNPQGRSIRPVTRVHTNPGLTVATWTPDLANCLSCLDRNAPPLSRAGDVVHR